MAHYQRAENLLEDGRRVVDQIRSISELRQPLIDDDGDPDQIAHDTRRMDELGKKVMGIWAQAQVHATLATISLRP